MGGRPARRSISNRRKTIVKVSRPNIYIYIYTFNPWNLAAQQFFNLPCPVPAINRDRNDNLTNVTRRPTINLILIQLLSSGKTKRREKNFSLPPLFTIFRKIVQREKGVITGKIHARRVIFPTIILKICAPYEKHVYIYAGRIYSVGRAARKRNPLSRLQRHFSPGIPYVCIMHAARMPQTLYASRIRNRSSWKFSLPGKKAHVFLL